MKIKTESWHYRLVSRFSTMHWIDNFCPYMRRLTLILVLMVVAAPSVLYGMIEMAILILMGKGYMAWLNPESVFGLYSIVCQIFGLAAWIIGIVYGTVMAALYVGGKVNRFLENNDAWQARQHDRAKRAMRHEPGIFMQWCKARHDQICPIVEFVSEEKPE